MIHVECPSCAAPYDLDESRLPERGLKMRCPKCSATFVVRPDGTVGEATPARAAPKRTQMGVGAAPPP
ncbi:MAG: zinc-ribbon domain-containing protein, partial [Myxococcota bacterium]